MFKKKSKTTELLDQNYKCKNCGTEFMGRFCPHCSQSIKEFEQPIGFMIVDFVGNMFAFDTRFWKTFKAVLYKPGHMAKSFALGHRVRYMPPFRFYIFISFIFFILLNFNINNNINTTEKETNKNNNTELADSLKIVKADSILRAKLGEELSEEETDTLVKSINTRFYNKKYYKKDSLSIDFGKSDAHIKEKVKKLLKDTKAHPDYYISKALSLISWSLFLFMPFFAFLLWLFFRKSYKYYVIHLVFAINQHAFLFIIFSLMLIINIILPNAISEYSGYLLLVLPVYHFIGAKYLYKLKTKTTIFRLLTIGFIYWLSLLIGLASMIGLWLYFGYLGTVSWTLILLTLVSISLIISLGIYVNMKFIKTK